MSPHGYIDSEGQPRLVITIPANDDVRANEIIRAGWKAWLDDCDDQQLRALLEAALRTA